MTLRKMEDDDGPPELGPVEAAPPWLTKALAQPTYKKDEDFERFDANGDGLLDLDEIVTYFTASFFAEGKGECEREHGLTPGEMAEDMAYQIFEDAGKNQDEAFTPAEFKKLRRGFVVARPPAAAAEEVTLYRRKDASETNGRTLMGSTQKG